MHDIEREKSVDDVERRRCGVGNGLDRGCVDVVVDVINKMPVRDVLTPNTRKDNKSTKNSYKQNANRQTPGQW